MKEDKGDLWGYPADYRCVTTNGVVKPNGKLVMGAGVALDAKKAFPHLPAKLGAWVTKYGNRAFLCREEGLITFPTKHHWRDPSDLALIVTSAQQIVTLCNKLLPPDTRVVLSRPGCGNGGLDWNEVKPLIEDILDDRFIVVTLD